MTVTLPYIYSFQTSTKAVSGLECFYQVAMCTLAYNIASIIPLFLPAVPVPHEHWHDHLQLSQSIFLPGRKIPGATWSYHNG